MRHPLYLHTFHKSSGQRLETSKFNKSRLARRRVIFQRGGAQQTGKRMQTLFSRRCKPTMLVEMP